LRLDWVYKINGPFWSVATEWQIYFFFPLIFLPLWRRWGLFAAILVAFAIGLAPRYLVPDPIPDDYNFLDWAVPWYLGLFTLGMAGAAIGFSSQPSLKWWQDKLPWQWICLGFLVILMTQRSHWTDDRVWLVDVLLGAVAASLLIYCTRCLTTDRQPHPFILKLLASPWAVILGSFSYSLYLVHAPLLGIVHLLVNNLPISAVAQILIFPVLAIPIVLILSYCFHLVFERRFISS
jgi:peptidoglycan/LPS O-acetylase OafA/YrhL